MPEGIGSVATEFLVLGCRISRVLSSDDLLTLIVFRSKSEIVTGSARGFLQRASPCPRQRAKIVLYGSLAAINNPSGLLAGEERNGRRCPRQSQAQGP